MLLVLVAGLLAGSLLVLLIKRTRETLLMSAVCLTLTIFLAGVMILISKQGGISRELERVLFFSHAVRVWLQYRFITLNQLGLVVSVGRHLFPLCLLEMSLYYSRLSAAANARRLHWLALLCPAASLTAYWPGFYRGLIPPDSGLQAALYYFSYLWAAGYVVLALLLLALELRAIHTPFCRRQFGKTALCLLALSALYLLYCGQDPGQIYRFYSYDYLWIRGAGYLQYTLSVGGYVLLTAGNVICGALALASLLMYTQDTLTARERETGLERRFDVARSGASVFVHSIKNQLLANRVLHKRIRGELQREAPDLEKLRQYVDSLSQNNEQLITRSEELYRTVKSKSVRLFPISLDRLERVALDRCTRRGWWNPGWTGTSRCWPMRTTSARRCITCWPTPGRRIWRPAAATGLSSWCATRRGSIRSWRSGIRAPASLRRPASISLSLFTPARTPTSTGAWGFTTPVPLCAATWAASGWRTTPGAARRS